MKNQTHCTFAALWSGSLQSNELHTLRARGDRGPNRVGMIKKSQKRWRNFKKAMKKSKKRWRNWAISSLVRKMKDFFIAFVDSSVAFEIYYHSNPHGILSLLAHNLCYLSDWSDPNHRAAKVQWVWFFTWSSYYKQNSIPASPVLSENCLIQA